MIRTLLILLLINLAFAQDTRPLIEVQSAVDTSLITIGDRIKYTVSIDYKEGMRVEKPGAGVNLGQFEIKNYKIHEPESQDGRVFIKYEYVISVFDTGKFTIPPFPVAYFPTDSTKDYKIIEANPINIYVESVIQDGDKELIDIKSPIYIPFDYLYAISIIVVIIGLLVAAFFGYKFYRKRKEAGYLFKPPEPPRPAHEIALEALEQLFARDLLGQGEVKQFYIKISEIIRRYIEGRFFIQALEETSYEILSEIRGQEISSDIYDELKEFLELSDLVKFAKYIPDEKENNNAIDQSRRFVEATMIDLSSDNTVESNETVDVESSSGS